MNTLTEAVLRGQSEIFRGSGATQSTVVFPSATISAWDHFFATAGPNPTGLSGQSSAAARVAVVGGAVWVWAIVLVVPLLVRLV